MLFHEIVPAEFHNEYFPYPAREEDIFLGYHGDLVLADAGNGGIRLPAVGEYLREVLIGGTGPKDAKNRETGLSDFRYLFSVDDIRFFTLTDHEAEAFGPYTFQTMRYLRIVKPMHLAYAAAVGAQLYQWYRRTRFCGACGEKLVHAEKERMMRCPVCGEMYFPVISPSVIVAVQREVMEEVGLRVKNIRIWKNQPWPFSSTLLLGYFCDLEGSDRVTLQEDELSVAEWVDRSDMPDRSADISLTSNMMEAFRKGEDPE